VPDDARVLLVTCGNRTTGMEPILIRESAPLPPTARNSTIEVFNCLPGSDLTLDLAAEPVVIPYRGRREFSFVAGNGFRAPLRVQGRQGPDLDLPKAAAARWLVFVHLDAIGFERVVITRLAHGNSAYAGPEAASSTETPEQ